MAENAWDAVGQADKNTSSGVVIRRLIASTHLDIPGTSWAACRAAAVLGQTDFDSWVASSSLDSACKSWYSGLASAVKAAIRESALLLD